jgi:hypothetical protein
MTSHSIKSYFSPIVTIFQPYLSPNLTLFKFVSVYLIITILIYYCHIIVRKCLFVPFPPPSCFISLPSPSLILCLLHSFFVPSNFHFSFILFFLSFFLPPFSFSFNFHSFPFFFFFLLHYYTAHTHGERERRCTIVVFNLLFHPRPIRSSLANQQPFSLSLSHSLYLTPSLSLSLCLYLTLSLKHSSSSSFIILSSSLYLYLE